MTRSRYVVGVDLGTTNSALAYADTGTPVPDGVSSDAVLSPVPFAVPQIVQPGVVEDRPLLPSFMYLPAAGELPAGSLKLPWDPGRDVAVGEFARNHGALIPTRLVASAKSWLCHPGIDRRAQLLPWKAPEGARRVSPLEASTHYLRHLAEAWKYRLGADDPATRLEAQDIVLTVPASFDAVARELTVEAARSAGLERVTLLEEPQAAFYAWIEAGRDGWRDQVSVGDVVLVCDVGGGTTDFTLIAVGEENGALALTRIAVGDHILLGGDNMDLALAHHAAGQFAARNIKLDAGQMQMLGHSCRAAKESLFRPDSPAATAPVLVLGRGSRVIGGTLRGELARADVETLLLDGFFPDVPAASEPKRQRPVGFQELGLPYAGDAAVTRHLAWFLARHRDAVMKLPPAKHGPPRGALPTAILFNGGVFKAAPLRDRLIAVLNRWLAAESAEPVKVLAGSDLDLAVSCGATYYGLVRRGQGIRIRGGTARSYYVGIETAQPAVPGSPPPIKTLCVAPFGMEEGTETDVPGQEFGLVVGEPAEMRFLGSSVRRSDTVGTMVEDWEPEIEELNRLSVTLDAKHGGVVPVHLHSKVTEIGTLEVWCHSRDGKQRWKLEFNVRESPAG